MTTKDVMFTWDASKVNFSIYFLVINGASITNVKITPQVFDLTMMFGAGNEPTTVAEFEKYYNEWYRSRAPDDEIDDKYKDYQ